MDILKFDINRNIEFLYACNAFETAVNKKNEQNRKQQIKNISNSNRTELKMRKFILTKSHASKFF